jgi:uncharacterized protein (TIRG00374 family)
VNRSRGARLRAWLSIALRYAFGIFLVYWLLRTEVLDLSPLRKISGALVAEGLVLGFCVTAISAARIQALLRDQRVIVSYARCFVCNAIGLFYSLFLPGGISGDAARAYYFFRDAPNKRIAVVGALLIDRFLGLITLIALGIVSGLFLISVVRDVIPYLVGSALLLVTLVVGLIVAVRYEISHRETAGAHRLLWLWGKTRLTFARLHLNQYSGRTLGVSVVLSALMNVLMIVIIYLCSILNQSGLGLMEVAAVSPLGLLTNAIPLSPGGLGVGEKSFDVLYKALGGVNGAGSFLVTRIFLYSPALVGAVFAAYFLLKLHHAPPLTTTQADP